MAAIGMGISGLGTIAQIGSNWANFQWSKDKVANYENMLSQAYARANQLYDQDYNVRMGALGSMFDDYALDQKKMTQEALRRTYGDAAANQADMAYYRDSLVGKIGALGADVVGQYQNRLNTMMGMIDQSGQAREATLYRDYGAMAGSEEARARGAGLGGTTIATGMKSAVQRQQQYALEDLRDALLERKIGTYGEFSGDAIRAQQRYGDWGIQAGQTYEDAILASRMGMRSDASDITLGGMETQADLRRMKAGASMDTQSEYLNKMAQLELSYPQQWGNFVTQNPVEFPDFSPLTDFGGQLMAYDQQKKQMAAAKKAQSRSNALGWASLGTNVATMGLWGAGLGSEYGWWGGSSGGGSGFMQPDPYTTYWNPYAMYGR